MWFKCVVKLFPLGMSGHLIGESLLFFVISQNNPYESLRALDRNLTLKALFLLALALMKRVDEPRDLSDTWRDGASSLSLSTQKL